MIPDCSGYVVGGFVMPGSVDGGVWLGDGSCRDGPRGGRRYAARLSLRLLSPSVGVYVPEQAVGEHWYRIPMRAVVDAAGRVVVPKPLREAMGLRAGSAVEISRYGAGLQLIPAGRTARLQEEDGVLVAAGETTIDDEVVFGLIDIGRK